MKTVLFILYKGGNFMAEFKKLSAVEAVEAVSDAANVLIEEDGVIKRAPKGEVGGIKVASTAEVGQTIVVKAVDAAGNPTEWECADMSGGYDAVFVCIGGNKFSGTWMLTQGEGYPAIVAKIHDCKIPNVLICYSHQGGATPAEVFASSQFRILHVMGWDEDEDNGQIHFCVMDEQYSMVQFLTVKQDNSANWWEAE
jgi:hypothetical protein